MNLAMCRFLLASLFVVARPDSSAEEPLIAFTPDSRWSTEEIGDGRVTGAGRAGAVIGLEGTGGGLGGDSGKGVLWHRTGQQFNRAITARVISLEGAGERGEAGVWINSRDARFGDVGMRLIYRSDGTLRWESTVYTEPSQPHLPVTGLALPLWLRINFYGGGLQGYYSSNGTDWTPLSAHPLGVTLPPHPAVSPALLVSSVGQATPAKARFDNVAVVDGDADDNGILDGWEIEHFQRLLGSESDADPDEDGATNTDEWLWGTHPQKTDGQPVLRIEPIVDGRIRVSLPVPAYSSLEALHFETSTS